MKEKLPIILYILSGVLLAGFIGTAIYDCYRYFAVTQFYAAPLWLYIAVDALKLLFPSAVCFVVAKAIRRKQVQG